MINKFSGDYAFLSNFYTCPVYYGGLFFKNSEAAFHAQKSLDNLTKCEFTHLDGREAKRKGRKVKLRADWESVKTRIMFEIVLAKFMQNKKLREMLLNTGDELLVEGNTWNDRFWGAVNGEGENYLGRILMSVREIVRMTEQSGMKYGSFKI